MLDGPSSKSGLLPGDVILSLDGQTVNTSQELRDEIRQKPIGQPITLAVFRTGKMLNLRVSPGEYPASEDAAIESADPPRKRKQFPELGITTESLTPKALAELGAKAKSGVRVSSVAPNSPAAHSEIRAGEVITEVGDQSVSTPEEFSKALEKADLEKGILIRLISGRSARFEILKQGGY